MLTEYKGIFKNNFDTLFTEDKKKLRKIGKNYILPNISPRENRLFIQKPSLIRKLPKLKPDLTSFQDVIERSLSTVRANRSKINDISKDNQIKEKNKHSLNIKTINLDEKIIDEKNTKFTIFRRFMSNKPLKNKKI